MLRAIDCVQEAITLIGSANVEGWVGAAAMAETRSRLSVREEYLACNTTLEDALGLIAEGNA